MFWKDKTNENERVEQTSRRRRADRSKKEKPPMPENLVDWADRVVVRQRSGDFISGRKRKSPYVFITVLTLTMLIVCVALICIYK